MNVDLTDRAINGSRWPYGYMKGLFTYSSRVTINGKYNAWFPFYGDEEEFNEMVNKEGGTFVWVCTSDEWNKRTLVKLVDGFKKAVDSL